MAKSLAELLVDARRVKGVSLREVERNTGISNAYLSQIETGTIQEPSPHKLHALAEYYGIEYDTLMTLAGYAVSTSKSGSQRTSSAQTLLLADKNLTEEEAAALVAFLTQYRKIKSGSDKRSKR